MELDEATADQLLRTLTGMGFLVLSLDRESGQILMRVPPTRWTK